MISNLYEGLGLIYDFKDMNVCEVGMYREGVLNGYGMKLDHKSKF
jgi:hypothetical protein